MELFGRRWDRWDAMVAAGAVTLILVSYQPWYTLHDEGSVTIWNARTHWELSQAVALGLVAAALHLAYRGRPEARGAAWLGACMLLGAVGLVGWHWRHASAPNGKAIVLVGPEAYPSETPEQYRRRVDEDFAARLNDPAFVPTRSAPQWSFYLGAGSLIVMGVAAGRTLARSQPSRAEAG
jgi:hypothetical protein